MATSGATESGHVGIGRVVRSRGFSLIELMIVVAIIAVLASIAYPSYIKYVTKTRRNAATACLSEYANYMERYYTTNLSYTGAGASLDCAATTQTGDYYGYSLPSATSSAYKILATPLGAQATRDAACGALGLDQTGTRFVLTSTSTAGPVTECWK